MDLTKKILLMWSGGISSTCALVQLLTDSQYKNHDILVHHCHLQNGTLKAHAESIACANIIKYVSGKKKYRKFFFSESNHEYSFLQTPNYSRTIYDLDLVSFIGANICAGSPNIEHMILGGTKSDVDDNEHFLKVLERSQRILNEALSLENHAMSLSVEYPLLGYELSDVIKNVPAPMRKLTMSCVNPKKQNEQFEPCGECYKCAIHSK